MNVVEIAKKASPQFLFQVALDDLNLESDVSPETVYVVAGSIMEALNKLKLPKSTSVVSMIILASESQDVLDGLVL